MDLFWPFHSADKKPHQEPTLNFFKGFLVWHQWWRDTTACDELDAFDCD